MEKFKATPREISERKMPTLPPKPDRTDDTQEVHKRGRKAAARIGDQKGVVTGELATKREEEKESSCVPASRKNGRTEKSVKNKSWLQVQQLERPLVHLGLSDPLEAV